MNKYVRHPLLKKMKITKNAKNEILLLQNSAQRFTSWTTYPSNPLRRKPHKIHCYKNCKATLYLMIRYEKALEINISNNVATNNSKYRKSFKKFRANYPECKIRREQGLRVLKFDDTPCKPCGENNQKMKRKVWKDSFILTQFYLI